MNHRMPEDYELVICVDAHKHTHTAAAIEAATGSQLDVSKVVNDADGYATLLDGVADRPRMWAIEGAGGYGAGLPAGSPHTASWSQRSNGPTVPRDATAPSPIPSTRCEPPAKPWPPRTRRRRSKAGSARPSRRA